MPGCAALTNHMCVTVAASWRPCCRFNNFPHVSIHDISFSDYKNSDFYKKIVSDMDTGWAIGCNKCKTEEERGHTSLRQVLNSELSGNSTLEYIEISISNECNLACRMCSPTYSTFWGKLVSTSKDLQKYHVNYKQPHISIDTIFKDIDISKLKKIKYLGGEPFVTPQIGQLFKYLEENGVIQNIEFECNTNCTLFPKKWLVELSKFKKLNIELSVDGVGDINEYIRFGKSWKIIYQNILKWVEYKEKNSNLNLSLYTTVQAYNLHDIKNICNLATENGLKFYSSLLVVPEYLSVNALPRDYLDEIKDEYNQKYYKSISPNTSLFEEFKKYTSDLDNSMNNRLQDVIPELFKYMNGDSNE